MTLYVTKKRIPATDEQISVLLSQEATNGWFKYETENMDTDLFRFFYL